MDHDRKYEFTDGRANFDYVIRAGGQTCIPLPAQFTGTVDLQFTGDVFSSTSMELIGGVADDQELARVQEQDDQLYLCLPLDEGFNGTVKVTLEGSCGGERKGMRCHGGSGMVTPPTEAEHITYH
jgi:hypothetical protein